MQRTDESTLKQAWVLVSFLLAPFAGTLLLMAAMDVVVFHATPLEAAKNLFPIGVLIASFVGGVGGLLAILGGNRVTNHD